MTDSAEHITQTIDHPLPISKLRGVPPLVRLKLKGQRITTCAQLLMAAAPAEGRSALAEASGLDAGILLMLIRRADIARIKGIGTVFGLMLEEIGVLDIESLALQDSANLHDALRRYNAEERLARRSPTLEEVGSWITDARQLPIILTYSSEEASIPATPLLHTSTKMKFNDGLLPSLYFG